MGPEKPFLRQLLGAIHVADACLARGDVDGALHATLRYAVLTGGEVQSLARLAEAMLLHEPSTGVARLTKTLALATFVAVAKNDHHDQRCDLPVPGSYWGPVRIDALVHRAEAWLAGA